MANDFRFLEFRVDKYGVKRMTQEELAKKLNLTRSRIVALEQKPDVIPTREDLQAYCTYFDTTADYLLGIRDTKTVDENIAMISKTTGLNEQAIESLKEINIMSQELDSVKKDLDILNFIMRDSAIFCRFLSVIRLFIIRDEYTTPLYYNSKTNFFTEYKMPEYIENGKYISIRNSKENGYDLHIGCNELIEGYAKHCISKQLEEWRIKYQDERK